MNVLPGQTTGVACCTSSFGNLPPPPGVVLLAQVGVRRVQLLCHGGQLVVANLDIFIDALQQEASQSTAWEH